MKTIITIVVCIVLIVGGVAWYVDYTEISPNTTFNDTFGTTNKWWHTLTSDELAILGPWVDFKLDQLRANVIMTVLKDCNIKAGGTDTDIANCVNAKMENYSNAVDYLNEARWAAIQKGFSVDVSVPTIEQIGKMTDADKKKVLEKCSAYVK